MISVPYLCLEGSTVLARKKLTPKRVNNMKEDTRKVQLRSMALPAPLDLESQTRDILLLYFKRGMKASALAGIFSLSEEEITEIVSKFAGSFSRREYMMNVIDNMAKLGRKERSAPGRVAAGGDARDAEIAELRRLLSEKEVELDVYREMVRVAEMTYNIPIRKKFGAK